jgi:tRNA(fMet)-specific endonuclease VapC
MACLDTTFFIDFMGRGGKLLQSRARQKVDELVASGEVLTTTRVNVAELWVGVERARDRSREIESIERLLSSVLVLELDRAGAEYFGRITAFLQVRGTPRGDFDVLIASIALAHGELVVTRNTAHFEGIPGLRVESY